jgi:hypothetical protein
MVGMAMRAAAFLVAAALSATTEPATATAITDAPPAAATAAPTTLSDVLVALGDVQAEQRSTSAKLEELQEEQRRTCAELNALKAALNTPAEVDEEGAKKTRRLGEEPTTGDDNVRIIYRTMTTEDFVGPDNGFGGQTGSGGGGSGGGGKHRRTQPQACVSADLSARLDALQTICCDEPNEDCSSGFPNSCNEGCAAAMASFWTDCEAPFAATSTPDVESQMQRAVDLCAAAISDNQALSLAELFDLSCTDAHQQTPLSCVPHCEAATHGDVLLATIDGDSTLNCH